MFIHLVFTRYDRIFPVTRDPSDIPLPRTNITPWYALGWILTGQEVRNQFDPQGVVDDMDPIATAIRCRFFKQKLNETAASVQYHHSFVDPSY